MNLVVHEAEPFNAEPLPGDLCGHQLTPTELFYHRNHGPVLELDPDAWRLQIDGLVPRPRVLSLADLQQRFEPVTLVATLQCAGNRRAGLAAVREIPGEALWRDGATSTARWTGVRLRDVLRACGVDDCEDRDTREQHVAFAAPDVSQLAAPPQPFGASIPMRKAASEEVLLAWAMNGTSLTAPHGAPVRVVVPGWIGARSVKWVERVTVQDRPSDNYFQAVAYRLLPPEFDPAAAGPGDGLSLGAVALNSAILAPAAGQVIPAGPTRVSGYAFAGDGRRVVRVDVSGDGGASWVLAELGTDGGRWAWRLWEATVDVPAGDAVLVARAWDDTGALQPSDPADLWNPKGYVNNSWPRNEVIATSPG